MKTVLMLLVLLLGTPSQPNENFHIIQVHGKIIHVESGKRLKSGDVISASDRLKFKTSDAFAVLINDSHSKFRLRPRGNNIAAVKDLISPVIEVSIRTRGCAAQGAIKDLKTYFGDTSFAVIGNSLRLKLDKKKYPLDARHFIIFSYQINGVKISKKLENKGQELIIEKEKLQSGKGQTLSGNKIEQVKVFMYDAENYVTEEITSFSLIFVNQDSLKNEFQTIVPILKKNQMESQEIKLYLSDYFIDIYGHTDPEKLNEWVAKLVE